jgi:sulfide:quinone oxidoreductase
MSAGADASSVLTGRPHRIVVVGGGFAAAEALLALRAHGQERVALELVSASDQLVFRPAATGEAFGAPATAALDLHELTESVGATFHRGMLESIAPRVRRIRLASGAARPYDSLVLALGARARAAVPGALTFRDQRDLPAFERVLEELRAGELRRLVLAAPTGATWTLPLHELALQAGRVAQGLPIPPEVIVVTPEHAPLELFGSEVAAEVAELHAARDVRLVRGAQPRRATREGLELTFGGLIAGDRVVTVPRLTGPPISGLPGDWHGFVPVDGHGRVEGLDDVYAAGDMTAFPVKQGGLAAQQADAVAIAIARSLGAPVPDEPARHVLRARLLGGDGPLYLRAELDALGHPQPGATISTEALWWPPDKVFARHLSAWLALRAPLGAAA